MITESTVERESTGLLNGKLAELNQRITDLAHCEGDSMVMEAADYLAALAIKATRVQAYANTRCQGSTHDTAVKRSNQAVAKVRKALGYTVGPDPLSF